jgi:hypothetical protein
MRLRIPKAKGWPMLNHAPIPAAVVAICFASLSPARAVQIVTNGGFETFTGAYPAQIPTGWTMTPFNVPYAVGLGGNAHTGQAAIAFGIDLDTYPALVYGELDQVLATNPGSTYTISFWLKMAGTIDDMKVEFGNTTLVELTNKATGYKQYTYTAVATQSATDLQFYGYDKTNYMYLDDVSVTGPAYVPEPASAALLATVAPALLAGRRGRRRNLTPVTRLPVTPL